MHDILGELAWRSLAGSDQKRYNFSTDVPAFAPEWLKQDYLPSTVEKKIGHYSRFLDLMGWQSRHWRQTPEYLLDGGKAVPHGLADHNLNMCFTSWALYEPESTRVVLRQFIPKIVNEIKRGNMEKALLFMGVVMHFIQDATSPAHMFPNTLLYDLSPEETTVHYNYHVLIDYCPVDSHAASELKTVTPALLGTTIPEIIFRTGALMDKDYLYAKRHLIRMLELCRVNDKEALAMLVKPLLQSAVFTVASLFHTLLAVGTGVLKRNAIRKIKTYDLLESIPYNIHPGSRYRNYMVGKWVNDAARLIPIRIQTGNGYTAVHNALSFSSFCAFRYLLEPGAFSRFEGRIALAVEGQNAREDGMETDFFIGTDCTYNLRTASDLEYGKTMQKKYKIRITPRFTQQSFSIELGRAKTLLLGAISKPKAVGGKVKYFFPDLFLVNPRLVK